MQKMCRKLYADGLGEQMEKLPKNQAHKLVIVVGIVSYALQFTWESLQCEPFFIHPPTNWMAADMFGAAMGDVAATYLVYIIVSEISKSWTWFLAGWTKMQWFIILGLGLISSVSFEILASVENSWGYTELAPLIPGLNISMIPVLQFLLLFPLSFGISAYILKPIKFPVPLIDKK